MGLVGGRDWRSYVELAAKRLRIFRLQVEELASLAANLDDAERKASFVAAKIVNWL